MVGDQSLCFELRTRGLWLIPDCVCDPDNKAADLKKPAQGAELRGSAGAALHGLAGRGCAALLEAGVLRDLCARQ